MKTISEMLAFLGLVLDFPAYWAVGVQVTVEPGNLLADIRVSNEYGGGARLLRFRREEEGWRKYETP